MKLMKMLQLHFVQQSEYLDSEDSDVEHPRGGIILK